MAQENINMGSYPDDPVADSIRTAFSKTQNNFTELFNVGLVAGVGNVYAGPGITVSNTTGDVTVNANIHTVRFASNSLLLGINTPYVGNIANITTSTQILNIDVNPNAVQSNLYTGVGGLANFEGTLTATSGLQPNLTQAPNLYQVGNLSNLTVVGSVTSGNATLGNTVIANWYIGNVLSPNQPYITNVGVLSNLVVSGNITANHVVANTFTGVFTGSVDTVANAAQPNITSLGTLTGLTVAGNITSTNANLGNVVTANYFSGNGHLLTNVSAIVANTVANSSQPNITSVGNLADLNVLGTLNFGALSAATVNASPALANVPNYKIPIQVNYPNGVSTVMYICLTDQP